MDTFDIARLPRPPKLPSWRSLLADRRAARAALALFDKLAAAEAAKSIKTVRPPRGRK